MKDWLKDYFKSLLDNKSKGVQYGEDLTLHIRFVKKDGSLTEPIFVEKVSKSELGTTQNNK